MKKFACILFLTLLLVIPYNAKALCFSEEKARLKTIISNVNISYDYQIVGEKALFSIKFSNLNPEVYFKDPAGNYHTIYDLQNNEIVLNNYTDGKSYTFNFYGMNTCTDENIGNLYVTLPSYNPYYTMSVCNNAKEFELCQKWVSHSLTRSEFIQKVNEYIEKKGMTDDTEAKKEISIIDFMISYIRMYGLYIAIIIVIIIFAVKFIRYKKDTFGF